MEDGDGAVVESDHPTKHVGTAISLIGGTLAIVGTLVGVGIRLGELSGEVRRGTAEVAEVKALASACKDQLNAYALSVSGVRDNCLRNSDDIEHIARRLELLEQRRH